MNDIGYVYQGILKENELREIFQCLGKNTIYIIWNLKSIKINVGQPDELYEHGILFNDWCEIRWQRLGEEFQVLVLCDREIKDLPLNKLNGEWKTKDEEIRLVQLNLSKFNPPFESYPITNAPKAKMRCKIFYYNNFAIFVSPREVINDG